MPIELEDLPPRKEFALRPWGVMVWVALFLLCALVGMAAVTFLWPADKPTMTLKWWNWLAIFPGCTFAGLCTLHYTVFGALRNKVIDWNEDHDDAWDEETIRGQTAIRLYHVAYASPLGTKELAQRLAHGESTLSTEDVPKVGHVMCSRFSSLVLERPRTESPTKIVENKGDKEPEDFEARFLARKLEEAESADWAADNDDIPTSKGDATNPDSQGDGETAQVPQAISKKNQNEPPKSLEAQDLLPGLFEHLLKQHAPVLRAFPVSRARICLVVNEALNAFDPKTVWQKACRDFGLNLPEPELLPDGLMALDRWLDERDAGKPFPLTLVVSVTRFDAPPARGGDAAVAMLLGPDVNDKHLALPPIAWVHRPELLGRVANPVPLSMEYALRWGGFLPELLDTVWLSGLDQETQVPVLSALRDIGLPPEGHPRVDIAAALGNTDVTGGWLALAAAVEHGQGNGKAQYIVAADPKTVAMVVEPVQRAAEPVESADLATQAA